MGASFAMQMLGSPPDQKQRSHTRTIMECLIPIYLAQPVSLQQQPRSVDLVFPPNRINDLLCAIPNLVSGSWLAR